MVFEQKLRAAGDATVPTLRVLPANFLILSVLDQSKNQLRVYVNRVGVGMALSPPKIFPVKNANHFVDTLPRQVTDYLASVAGLKPRATTTKLEPRQGKPLNCSLLEPVSTGGAQADLSKVSPLIRAVLEDVIANDATQATLVDRTESAAMLEEKTLTSTNGLDANGATDLGRLAKADLILIPFIHFKDSSKISTDLFAVDVATGRMLASRSWSGGLLDAPPAGLVKELLQEGLQAAGESMLHPIADDPAQRHAEATFIVGLKESWAGLRQTVATEAELSLYLADASLALASDDPVLMKKASLMFYVRATPGALYPLRLEYEQDDYLITQIQDLKKSGQLDFIYRQARRIFELPMTELAKNGGDSEMQALAMLWIRLGDPEKAWSLLNRDGDAAKRVTDNLPHYQSIIIALMNLRRYQECVDLLERRGRWNSVCTGMVLDSYRALGNKKREFELMWVNAKSSCETERGTLRLLDLGTEQGKAGPVIGKVIANDNGWIISSPAVRRAIIRARVAAGQKEQAISDAQCALITAIRAQDKASEKEITDILTKLGAKPIDSLSAAHNFLTIPADYKIDLIHDQTEDPEYVREVAVRVASFWGCAVHIRSIKINASSFSSYNKLSQALEVHTFSNTIAHANLPTGNSLGTILLTQAKLISNHEGYKGDVNSLNRKSLLILSDYYFRNFLSTDTRPLAQVTAVSAANLSSVSILIEDHSKKLGAWDKVFCPPPPDLFTSSGTLRLRYIDLGVSPATGELLKSISFSELASSIPELKLKLMKDSPPPSAADQTLILNINQQISQSQPIIITP